MPLPFVPSNGDQREGGERDEYHSRVDNQRVSGKTKQRDQWHGAIRHRQIPLSKSNGGARLGPVPVRVYPEEPDVFALRAE